MCFSAMSNCSNCGNTLQLTGPLRNLSCDHCLATTTVDEEFWSFLEDVLVDVAKLKASRAGKGGSFATLGPAATTLNYHIEAPSCSQCGTRFHAANIATGSTDSVSCVACGCEFSTYPAGDLTQKSAPNLVQFFGAARENTPAIDLAKSESTKPVSFACPDCNGNLKITARHERTVTCEYCGSDCFLPDALWRRLHPVRGRCTWYFRFHDPRALARERREGSSVPVEHAYRAQHEAIVSQIEALAGSDDSAAEYKTFFAVTSHRERDDAIRFIRTAIKSEWALAETATCVLNLRTIFEDNKRERTLLRKLEVLLGERNGNAAISLVESIKTR